MSRSEARCLAETEKLREAQIVALLAQHAAEALAPVPAALAAQPAGDGPVTDG